MKRNELLRYIRSQGCELEKFSISEKIFIRIAFYGVIVIGAYGIYSESRMCKNKSVPFFAFLLKPYPLKSKWLKELCELKDIIPHQRRYLLTCR